MKEHIEMEEAKRLLEQLPVSIKKEAIALSESLDRILAEDCFSRLAVPPFDKSPFDGYACRAEDTPGLLHVAGVATAGCGVLPSLNPGEAIRIFTGAPLPAGADTIGKQENVKATGGEIVVPSSCVSGQNVIVKGEDIEPGTRLIGKGTLLEPGHLGLLASQGIDRLPVFRRPRAVLIPTGTELFEPGQERSSHGIYNSSSFTLSAAMKKMGLEIFRRDIVPDEVQAVAAAVRSALESDAQVVFTTGGASVGDFDFAAKTAGQLGAEPLFWKVNMKPGGALIFDVSTPEKLSQTLGDNTLYSDDDAVSYIWRNKWDGKTACVTLGLSLFVRRSDGAYDRLEERQTQRAHTRRELCAWLTQAGFQDISFYGRLRMSPPRKGDDRWHVTAVKAE